MTGRTGHFLVTIIVLVTISVSCNTQKESGKGRHVVSDSWERSMHVPDSIRSVTCLGSGALRLICYMDLADRVKYIEGNEKRRSVPYILANPRLREREVIGAGNNYDTELLAVSSTELIVTTFKGGAEADRLRKLTGKPVFALKYGNLGDDIDDFLNSISLIGNAFGKEGRADSLISYINATIAELKSRVAGVYDPELSAYIGGVAYSGSHGLTSTLNDYPPFSFISVRNSAGEALNESGKAKITNNNTTIDAEQLIEWDPDFLFLDASGTAIWMNEIDKPVFNGTMKAFRQKKVFTVLPYNWYTINYENVLCNSWYVGKTIYPEAFADVDIDAKCREIYKVFLGKDVFDEMNKLYRPFREAL